MFNNNALLVDMKSQVMNRPNTKSKHCSYFEHLESKLLDETDTLTDLIDKSHIHEHINRTLKNNLSTCNVVAHSAQLNKSTSSSSQARLSIKL